MMPSDRRVAHQPAPAATMTMKLRRLTIRVLSPVGARAVWVVAGLAVVVPVELVLGVGVAVWVGVGVGGVAAAAALLTFNVRVAGLVWVPALSLAVALT